VEGGVNRSAETGAGRPKITVGLMVHNEAKSLPSALEALLAQQGPSFEVLIADNESTDGSAEVGREAAERDARIRYYRHERNVGAFENFNSLVTRAEGEYFVLAAAHDLWSPTYLAELSRVLDEAPDAVLAYAPTEWLDGEGKPLARATGYIDTRGYSALQRFHLALWCDQHPIYGMLRLSALRQTQLLRQVVSADAILLAELALLGPFIVVPGERWYRRQKRAQENTEQRVARYQSFLFRSPRKDFFPHWRLVPAFAQLMLNAQLPPVEKARLVASLPTVLARYGNLMTWDMRQTVRRVLGRARAG
jgi:glycosyltransferase involved in cell wall biosynthesis